MVIFQILGQYRWIFPNFQSVKYQIFWRDLSNFLDSKDKKYSGKKADIWAMGVTLYNLLFETYPFNGSTHSELYKEIIESTPSLDFSKLKIQPDSASSSQVIFIS